MRICKNKEINNYTKGEWKQGMEIRKLIKRKRNINKRELEEGINRKVNEKQENENTKRNKIKTSECCTNINSDKLSKIFIYFQGNINWN